MSTPGVIRVATPGSLPRRTHDPAVPVTVAEQAESAQRAMGVGERRGPDTAGSEGE
jgi:uncharacterized protein (DUF849 family)